MIEQVATRENIGIFESLIQDFSGKAEAVKEFVKSLFPDEENSNPSSSEFKQFVAYLNDQATSRGDEEQFQEMLILIFTWTIKLFKAKNFSQGIEQVSQLICSYKIQKIIIAKLVCPSSQYKQQKQIIINSLLIKQERNQLINLFNNKSLIICICYLKIYVNILAFKQILVQKQMLSENEIIKQTQILMKKILERKNLFVNQQQIKQFVILCLQFEKYYYLQNRQNSQFGFNSAIQCIQTFLMTDNLSKKFIALSQIDFLLQQIQDLNCRYFQPDNFTYKLKIDKSLLLLIFNPRNHQQVINRSLGLIKYWFQNSQNEDDLSLLNQWLVNLIYEGDHRTSGIFGQGFKQLILKLNKIGKVQIAMIYKIGLRVLQKAFENTVQTRSQKNALQNRKKQDNLQVLKILDPLINKQFQPYQIYKKDTFNFLKRIFLTVTSTKSSLKQHVKQSLRNCIQNFISPQFNSYVVDQQCQNLQKLVKTKKFESQDQNVIKFSQNVSQIYEMISSFLHAIKNKSETEEENLLLNEISETSNNGLAKLNSQPILSFLIISHDSNNPSQLQHLLQIIELIIEFKNNQKFEIQILSKILKKVDNCNEFYLIWLKNRLTCITNEQSKKQIIHHIFQTHEIYNNINLTGLQHLLNILHISDLNNSKKQQFCINLLRFVKQQIFCQANKMILGSIWTFNEINNIKWIEKMAGEMEMVNHRLQIMFLMEIIKFSQYHRPCLKSGIYHENTAINKEIQVQFTLDNQQKTSKIVKVINTMSLRKLCITQIEPFIDQKYSIYSVVFDNRQIGFENFQQMLNTLGFQSHSLNCIFVRRKTKKFLKLKMLKDGALKYILNCGYNYEITLNIIQICIKFRWKTLHQQFQVINKVYKFNLQAINKQNLHILIKNTIQICTVQNYMEFTNELTEQLSNFINNFDIYQQMFLQNQQSQSIEHRVLISNEPFFLQKAYNLINSHNNKDRKVAYQFINMLIINKEIENNVCSNLDIYLCDQGYKLLFGLQILWMVLKNNESFAFFMKLQKHDYIFKAILKCSHILLQRDGNEGKQDQVDSLILMRIIATGLKILNKIIKLSVIQQKMVQVCLVVQSSSILNLAKIKNSFKQINEGEYKQKFYERQQIREYLNVLSKNNQGIVFNCKQLITEFYQNICRIVECNSIISQTTTNSNNNANAQSLIKNYELTKALKNHEKQQLINVIFTETSYTTCIFLVRQSIIQQEIIHHLIKNLLSKCINLSLASISLLFIYIKLNPTQHSKQILITLIQNYDANLKYSISYYKIYQECFFVCKDETLKSKIIENLFSILIQSKPQQQGEQINETINGILSIITSNSHQINTETRISIIEIIFTNYIFFLSPSIRAFHPKTRQICYQTVLSCLNNNDIDTTPFIQRVAKEIDRVDSNNETKRQNWKGVGIINLGNLCYMNALLQLLHCVEPFTQQISKINTEYPLLIGLQKLFISLTKSYKTCLDPQQFILCFEPPIEINLQQDTTYFLMQFFDKMQTNQKTHKFSNLTNNLFKGQNIVKIVCTSCKKQKTKIQTFINYTVSIKNENKIFNNIQQCINNNKKPEIIYDVQCQFCKQKRKFQIHTVLKTIPPFFIIHLKRLIFDFENPLTKIKIHSRITFPDTLIIDNQTLSLKAVIIHSGTGEYGHYYTTVKSKSGKWLIFNDSQVQEMSEAQRETLWYGGQEQNEFSTNAYVLLYEKQIFQFQQNSSVVMSPYLQSTLTQIQEQNKQLIQKHLLFGQQYSQQFTNFAFDLVRLPNASQFLKIYQILAKLSYNKNLITSIAPQTYFQRMPVITNPQQLLTSIYNFKQHNYVFLLSKNKQIRNFFYNFLTKIFEQNMNNELTQKYTQQLIKRFEQFLQQNNNFINCQQYIKIIAFFIRKYNLNEKIMMMIYELKLIENLSSLIQVRMKYIQMNYENTNNEITRSYIQLLLSYITIQNNSQIILIQNYQGLYKNIINNIIIYKQIIQLILLYNTQNQYKILLFQYLLLEQNNNIFEYIIQKIILNYLQNYQQFSNGKIINNLCWTILYVNNKYYQSHHQMFQIQILGFTLPVTYQHANHTITNLKQRTYSYVNHKMKISFMEMLTRLIISTSQKQQPKPQQLDVVFSLLQLLYNIMKSNASYLNWIKYLPSPIPLYQTYLQFQYQTLTQIINKSSNLSNLNQKTMVVSTSIPTKISQTLTLIDQLSNSNIQQSQEHDYILIGCHYKKEQNILQQHVFNNIFLSIDNCYNYYCKYHQQQIEIFQFINTSFQLAENFQSSYHLRQLISSVNDNQIQDQQQNSNSFNKQRIEQIPNIEHGELRKKITITNVSNPQNLTITIVCNNMKNKQLRIQKQFIENESIVFWIEKMRINENWGNIQINVNGHSYDLPSGIQSNSEMFQSMQILENESQALENESMM